MQAQAPNSPSADANQLILPAEKEATPERFLTDVIADKWRAISPVRFLIADSDVLEEYGVQKTAQRVYSNGVSQYKLAVFGTVSQAGAYGLCSFQWLPNREVANFHASRYCVNIHKLATESNETDKEFLVAVKNSFAGLSSRTPALIEKLPEGQSISPVFLYGAKILARYKQFDFLKDTLSFIGGTEVAITRYPNGNGQMDLLLAEFQTPQLATDGLAALQAQYDSLPQAEKDQRLIKRIGNYIAVANNIQDRPAAENLVKQIKYEMKVYWEGRKYSDIPLEYRGLDQVALAEASQTASVLLRAFYWIGIMLLTTIGLGVISGSLFFYWRRYQRRKLGQEDLFSDAGGSVRLNLDDYLLEAGTEKQKLLKKAD